ncbi:hypothetical protein [Streptomyces colonosanans]|uniref:hypothetical protein n=1 Tax=Streptomyces colonosanans TaxID=1428652 RepID=UPI0009A10282|nr:hypothetical protein [Streptomyces colonosanans]
MASIAAAGKMPTDKLAGLVGDVEPTRSLRAQRAYLSAFFDVQLRHCPDHGLLNGPSAAYREVSFID